MFGRLILLGVLFLALTLVMPHDVQAFYAFMALAFVINIPYALWLRNDATARRSAPLQFLGDVFVITGLVHYTGGIHSELFLLYPLTIISAGIVVSGYHSVKITLLSIILYATLIALEAEGVLAYRGPPPLPYDDLGSVVQCLSLRIFMFVFFSVASHYLAERCSYQASRLHSYQNLVQTMFDHMSIGLVTVAAGDRTILFANRQFCILTGRTPEQLVGRPLDESFEGDITAVLGGPAAGGRQLLLRTAAGGKLPVGINASAAALPLNIPHPDDPLFHETRDVEALILAVRDLSADLQAAANARRVQELELTFQVGSELAHSVRNPLTAIQCGCDGIRGIIGELRPKLPKELESDAELITQLDAIVQTQIVKVDADLNHFLNLATGNPADLLKTAADAYRKFCPPDDDGESAPAPAPAADERVSRG